MRFRRASSWSIVGCTDCAIWGARSTCSRSCTPSSASEVGVLRSLDAFPNNLPDQLTSFVGRSHELAQLREALAETRLLTLTGAGGAGKTRLALQLAADALEQFADGAWWVDLAPVADPRLVGEVLAGALGVRPLPMMTPLQASCARLAGSRALVVVDNCEHLLAACAEMTETLLRACPDVVVLATSRAPLGVGGETDWRVPSLSLPEPADKREPLEVLGQYDAVRLFIERARKARPNFAVTSENAPAVAQVCQELDGLPLAIELAAARVRMMSVQQIAAGLGDRFHLLTGGARTALPRHQTLRASVDWSHELLSEPEQVLLRRLAVFAGGFTLDLAEAACTDERLKRVAILDLLASLVDKSLVVAEEHGGEVRYRLLETVRQYGLERLIEGGEAVDMRDRHRDAMLELAERIAPELHGPGQQEWLGVLDNDAAEPGRRAGPCRANRPRARPAPVRGADVLVEGARPVCPGRARLRASAGSRRSDALAAASARAVGPRLPCVVRRTVRRGARHPAAGAGRGRSGRRPVGAGASPDGGRLDPDVSRPGREPSDQRARV